MDIWQIIYLRTRPEVAFERVLKRNQLEEANISFKYLKGVHSQISQEVVNKFHHNISFLDLHDLHEEWLYFKTKFQSLKSIMKFS